MSKSQDNLFYDAGLLILENDNASPEFLQSILNVNSVRANELLSQLEAEGIVSSDSGSGRTTMMTADEFKMIFADYFETKSGVKSITTDSKGLSSQKSAFGSAQKRKGGCCSCLFWLLFILLVLLLFGYYTNGVVYRIVNNGVDYFKPKTADTNNNDSINKSDSINMSSGINNSSIDNNYRQNGDSTLKNEMKNIVVGWVQEDDKYKYYDNLGNQVKSAWINIEGDLYYLDDNGFLVISSWVEYFGKEYYVDVNGKMLKNQWINDMYYVGVDGAKLKNAITPDGFFVDAEGKYTVTSINDNVASNNIEMAINESSIVPSEVLSISLSNIAEPSVGVEQSVVVEKVKRYQLKSKYDYNQTVYLDNDRKCNIWLLLPIFSDETNQEVIDLNELTLVERDNIITELEDFANSMIEEEDYSTKYMRSIVMQEGRLSTQDDYDITYKMTGKINWNTGRSERITISMIYDKNNNSMSYYID